MSLVRVRRVRQLDWGLIKLLPLEVPRIQALNTNSLTFSYDTYCYPIGHQRKSPNEEAFHCLPHVVQVFNLQLYAINWTYCTARAC